MRDEAAGFHGEKEVGGCRIPPGRKRFLSGEPIEGIVQLDCIEMADVFGEHPAAWQAGVIERPTPMFVVPPGCTDVTERDFSCWLAWGRRFGPPGASGDYHIADWQAKAPAHSTGRLQLFEKCG